MWQRWNQSTHIFEKSDNDGATWVPLPLSGATITEGVIPNVAYKNIDNNFTATQHITGELWTTASIVSGSAFHTKNAGFIYPGRYDVGADGGIQGSWYLASHGYYGLFTNTGLYVAGGVWAIAHLYSGGPVQDYARGYGMGVPQYWGAVPGHFFAPGGMALTASGISYYYSIHGFTCTIWINATIVLSGTMAPYFYCYAPITGPARDQHQVSWFMYNTTTGNGVIMRGTMSANLNYIVFSATNSLALSAGNYLLIGTQTLQFV